MFQILKRNFLFPTPKDGKQRTISSSEGQPLSDQFLTWEAVKFFPGSFDHRVSFCPLSPDTKLLACWNPMRGRNAAGKGFPPVWAREHISLIRWRSSSASTLQSLNFPFRCPNRSARERHCKTNPPWNDFFCSWERYNHIVLELLSWHRLGEIN